MPSAIGWDIGGANLKAARAEDGVIVAVVQTPCAPHSGVAQIETALRETRAALGVVDRHAVTMTAELSDAFPDRTRGVVQIAAICANELGASNLAFFAGARGLVSRAAVADAASSIASANWRVSAEIAARACGEALFIDVGSTTTDIIPISERAVTARGEDDNSRLAFGELVYTGLLRGSPAAGLARAPLRGCWTQLVDEQFATMADVHRILNNIPEGADMLPTADGRPKSVAASRARLARLVGCDAADATPEEWDALAAFLARAQWRRIEDQIALIASRAPFAARAPLIGAGVGRRLVCEFARREGRDYRDIKEFFATANDVSGVADCAPACALALLALEKSAGALR